MGKDSPAVEMRTHKSSFCLGSGFAQVKPAFPNFLSLASCPLSPPGVLLACGGGGGERKDTLTQESMPVLGFRLRHLSVGGHGPFIWGLWASSGKWD